MFYDYLFLVSATIVVLYGCFVLFIKYSKFLRRTVLWPVNLLSEKFKNKDKVSLLVNVGCGQISCGFVIFSKGKLPKFVFSQKVEFNMPEKQDLERLLQSTSVKFDYLLGNVIKEMWGSLSQRAEGKKISHLILSLSSPWFVSRFKDIHLSEEREFIVTDKLINDITVREAELFKKELAQNPENNEAQFDIIETSVINTAVGGEATHDVLKKKTKQFDASLTMSAVTLPVKNKFLDLLLRHTHIPVGNMVVQTSLLVLFSTLRDFVSCTNFLIIDVGAETTTMLFVKDQSIVSVEYIPFGKNTVIRGLAKSRNVSFEIAKSKISIAVLEKIHDDISASVNNIVAGELKEWAMQIENHTLAQSRESLIQEFFFTVDDEASLLLLDYIEQQRASGISRYTKGIRINRIDERFFSSLYETRGGVEISRDLVTLAIFNNRFM